MKNREECLSKQYIYIDSFNSTYVTTSSLRYFIYILNSLQCDLRFYDSYAHAFFYALSLIFRAGHEVLKFREKKGNTQSNFWQSCAGAFALPKHIHIDAIISPRI